MSRRALAYALLLSLPAAVAMGSGLTMLSGRPVLSVAVAAALFVGVFLVVYVGATRGEPDPTLAQD